MTLEKTICLIQSHLTPDLLQGRWRQQVHPLQGYCYVASEVLWHLLGRDNWKPMCATYEDDRGRATHWWLVNRQTGQIADPTKEQYSPNQPPYDKGRGVGFLTQKPSKRAQKILDAIKTR